MNQNSTPRRMMLMLRREQKEVSKRIHHAIVVSALNSPTMGA